MLLKNAGNVLPLAKAGSKIFVAGKSADDIGNQSGGWTISLAGRERHRSRRARTILQGIRDTVGSRRPRSPTTRTARHRQLATGAAIAVVGETPYAEGKGDRPGAMGLDATDLATLHTLHASGVPVVVVLVSGRPLDIAQQLPDWDALVARGCPAPRARAWPTCSSATTPRPASCR